MFRKYNNNVYLYSGFGEIDSHGDLLAHKNVRIMGLAEAPFQLVELRRREPGPVSLLFVRLSDVVAVEPAASGRGDSRSGSQPMAGRSGQIETAARQPEWPATTAATAARWGGQLRWRQTVALQMTVTRAATEAVTADDVVSAATRLQLV